MLRPADGSQQGRDSILSTYGSCAIWILSNSCIQHLSNWRKVSDSIGVAILNKLKCLSSFRIHLLRIPSDVEMHENNMVDTFAKEGAIEQLTNSDPLTYLELF
ncbi:hypothetical protein CDAR_194721 [Caerostris darwini]|uniref:Uncharacterized protein n=1 Tax=Caerostris darwini TaxID=1538125 RepID=A0AAV4X969_9ARAC|nr:hypothetical protein CDAR_194721 [Caerostris darwini]